MKLIARADASVALGAGHAMRCATLLRAWKREGLGPALFAGNIDVPFVAARLGRIGIARSDHVPGGQNDVLVVDTYDQDERRARARQPAACRVLVDDLGGEVPSGYTAIWHPHASGTAALYPAFDGPVICGPLAVPIREDLPRWEGIAGNDTIAVTLGAGLPAPTVLDAVLSLSVRLRDKVFVGAGDWTPANWRRSNSGDMWSEFVRCGRALTAAGGTVWEAAAIGIPVAIVQIAENQQRIAAWAQTAGAPVVRLSSNIPGNSTELLADALSRAAVLPRLTDGSATVARAIADLAGRV